MSFVSLHTHSHYSLLDGFGSPAKIAARCKDLGYPACALTDHGVTYGLIEFYNECKKAGVKPILGCEMYIATRTRFDKEAKIDVKPYHQTILAKNNVGYQNLLLLVSKANLEGFYYKPRIDYGLLKAHSEGLIALSGCITGHVPRLILSDDLDGARDVIRQHIEIFGKENYFLEVQDHPLIENQQIVNEQLREFAKEFDLPLVATNDTHYPASKDKDVHDVMLCVQTGTTVNEEDRLRYTGDYSIREFEDIKVAFKDYPGAIENTLKIADMCNVDFEFGKNLIPSFNTPNNEKADEYLRQLCEEGLARRFGDKGFTKEYTERLDYELSLVHEMGFDTYFLIVSDFVKFAKDRGILVGPGRGSAAGSIIAWTLDITDLDPIAYGLFFERFLNPERISMPDIDIDFADNRRDEVLQYVIEKYGRDNVAQIITFGTMAPKAAIRDAGRALGYPYAEVDLLSKAVPPPVLGKYDPLEQSIKDDPELSSIYRKDKRAEVLLDYAVQMEGSVRHIGTHACAVVISEKPLTEYTALQYGANSDNEIITQFSAKPLEALGLLKMDFLGLRNLTIIAETLRIVKERHDVDINIQTIPLDDKDTFAMLKVADTTGVFQLESGGMRRYLKDLKPNKFDDIVAMGALYRPGPMEWIPTYIKGKHNPGKVKYLHKSFKPILENTYGVAVYQEQILQLARDFAGFTLGQADILRKAVGKKDPELLAEQREKFIKGAVENEHDKKFAKEVFEKVIEPFAGYGFNKAHAVCYGMIAYQTAYLKAHYPVEFMTALLCSDSGNTDRVVLEVQRCAEMGIEVLPPSVNESDCNFTVVGDKQIRFGLCAIKGIGEGPINELIAARNKKGPFASLEDFAERVPAKVINKKLIQAMAYCGAFDSFGDRNQVAESFDIISAYAKSVQSTLMDDQISIFGVVEDHGMNEGGIKLGLFPKAHPIQRLKWEKDFLGMYVSSHPLHGLSRYLGRKGNMIGRLTPKSVGKTVKLSGLVSDYRKIMTRGGTYMLTFKIEDPSGKISCIMFPRSFAQYGEMVIPDKIISIGGKLDNKRGSVQVITDSAKILSLDAMIKNAKEDGYFDPDEPQNLAVRLLDDIWADEEVDDEDGDDAVTKDNLLKISIPKSLSAEKMSQLKDLLAANKGDTPAEIHLTAADKRIKLPFGLAVTDKLKKAIDSILR